MTIRRLTRSRTEGKVAGVCAGIANYFDVDVVLVRAAWVVFSIVPGAVIGGVLAYIAAWLLIPENTGEVPAAHGRRLARPFKSSYVSASRAGEVGVAARPAYIRNRNAPSDMTV